MRALLSAGADPRASNKAGQIPEALAALGGHDAAVRELRAATEDGVLALLKAHELEMLEEKKPREKPKKKARAAPRAPKPPSAPPRRIGPEGDVERDELAAELTQALDARSATSRDEAREEPEEPETREEPETPEEPEEPETPEEPDTPGTPETPEPTQVADLVA